MSTLKHSACVFLMSAPLATAAAPTEQYLKLATTTPEVTVKVHLDIPDQATPLKSSVVLLVGGTHDSADGSTFLPPVIEARRVGFLYRDIGRRLAARGYRVARLSSRGLGSVLECEALAGRTVTAHEYIHNTDCYNWRHAVTTTVESRVDDVVAAARLVGELWPKQPLLVIAHSEGGRQVAEALEQGRLSATALVMTSTFAQSPKDVSRWQRVERQFEWIAARLRDGRKQVSNEDIQHYPYQLRAGFQSMMYSPTGSWTRATLPALRAQLEEVEQRRHRYTTMQTPDMHHFAKLVHDLPDMPVSTLAYMRDLFADDVPVLHRLKDFAGPITYVYGDADLLVPVGPQLAAIAAFRKQRKVGVVQIGDADHRFVAANGQFQVKALEAIDRLVDAAERAAHSPSQ